MYPVVHENQDYALPFSEFPRKLGQALPTFDKSLDAYFDKNLAAIIKEWGLVTENDLRALENRLEKATSEIGTLCAGKTMIERRIENLEPLIASLERSL